MNTVALTLSEMSRLLERGSVRIVRIMYPQPLSGVSEEGIGIVQFKDNPFVEGQRMLAHVEGSSREEWAATVRVKSERARMAQEASYAEIDEFQAAKGIATREEAAKAYWQTARDAWVAKFSPEDWEANRWVWSVVLEKVAESAETPLSPTAVATGLNMMLAVGDTLTDSDERAKRYARTVQDYMDRVPDALIPVPRGHPGNDPVFAEFMRNVLSEYAEWSRKSSPFPPLAPKTDVSAELPAQPAQPAQPGLYWFRSSGGHVWYPVRVVKRYEELEVVFFGTPGSAPLSGFTGQWIRIPEPPQTDV